MQKERTDVNAKGENRSHNTLDWLEKERTEVNAKMAGGLLDLLTGSSIFDGGSSNEGNGIANSARAGADLCGTTRCVTPPLTLVEIVNRQNPAKCSSAKAIVVNSIQRTGFGTIIFQVLGTFVRALQEGKILIVEFPGWSYSQMACGDNSGWECFFAPLSKCQRKDISESNVQIVSSAGRDSNVKSTPLDVRHLLAYITRPSERFASRIATLKQQIGWPAAGSVITMHVRMHRLPDRIQT